MRFTAVAAVAMLVTSSAHAADRNVDLVNKTGMTMTAFYASVTNANS